MSDIIQPSEEQRKIIEYPKFNHTRVIACAGSGKTNTMIRRILFMIQHLKVDPKTLFVVTFTKNAARHMTRKINHALKQLSLDNIISTLTNTTATVPAVLSLDYSQLGTFHALSKRLLKKHGVLDECLGTVYNVDELQYHFLEFLKSCKGQQVKSQIKHIFVDEFQDVNQIQYDIVKELSQGCLSTTVVGDDDQNIFQFRDSSIKFIHDFDKDFENVVTYYLSTNYRCIQPIVNVANAIISKNRERLFKPESKSGVLINDKAVLKPQLINSSSVFASIKVVCERVKDLINNQNVKPSEICILSRNNYLLYTMQASLIKQKIKTLLMSGEDSFTRDLNDISERVVLSSIHSSKGLEWEHVYILGLHSKFFPSHREQDIASEFRLMYVACTRAKKYLTVCNSSEDPSQFITSVAYQNLFNVIGRIDEDNIIPLEPTLSSNLNLKGDANTDVKINIKSNESKVELKNELKSEDKVGLGKTQQVNQDWEGVMHCVRSLNGGDYIHLKRSIIPSNLSPLLSPVPPSTIYGLDGTVDFDEDGDPIETKTGKVFPYYSFISKNQIESEFGQFLDILARRMVAEYAYLRYKAQLKDSTSNGDVSDSKVKVKLETKTKLIMTLEEIQELFVDSEAQSCISGQYAKNVPREYIGILKEAYEKYKNPELSSLSIINYIYILSFCSSITKGKQYVLYVHVMRKDLQMYAEMYEKMQQQIALLIGDRRVKTAVSVSWCTSSFGMRGIIDMIVDDAIIVDFKNTLFEAGVCRIEFFIQVLIYAALWRLKYNKKIERVGIYNIIADSMFMVNISQWNCEIELIEYLIRKIRPDFNEKITPTNSE